MHSGGGERRRFAYARPITEPSDDLLDDLIPPPPGAPGPPRPIPAQEAPDDEDARTRISEDTQELLVQMGSLRGQLDAAFEEVVGRIDQVEARMRDLSHSCEVQASKEREAKKRDALIVELLHGLAARTAEVLAAIASSAPQDAGDTSRIRLEAGLEHLSRQLFELKQVRPEVDTSQLEEVSHRGSLRNAADIANLRQDVATLVEVIRRKDEGIGELRTTVAWIKERMLR